MNAAPAQVTCWRSTAAGPIAEAIHRVHVAIATADGALFAHAGDPSLRTPLRSCLKPFQAQILFSSGAAERFGLSDEELALACASHTGAPIHLERISAWLARLGLGEAALMCGAHPPRDPEGLAALAGAAPGQLHNNCSGKHTAMLAAALALGAPTRDYIRGIHPVQRLVRDAIDAVVPGADPAFAIDGCSAPTPVLTVHQLATMYARLAAGATPGLARTFDAMVAHPELVGGREVLDTRLMRALRGVAAKRGADGVYALALRPLGDGPALGVALKVESGSDEARPPVVLAILEALGRMVPAARVALKDEARPPRTNHRGLLVGAWGVSLDLIRS